MELDRVHDDPHVQAAPLNLVHRCGWARHLGWSSRGYP